MIWLVHAVLASAVTLVLWRAQQQAWVERFAADEAVAAALPVAFALGSGLASLAAILAGQLAGGRRMLVADAASLAGAAVVVSILAAGPASRDVVGIFLVAALAMRVAPSIVVVATRAVPARLAFLAALAAYAPLAVWLTATSLPFGDQVHYLLGADRLAQVSLDATIDAELFRSLLGSDPGELDAATHVIRSSAGPRTVQGYAMPLLLLPGWLAAQRVGAHLVVAVVAAWTSAQTYLLLRETAPAPAARVTWALASFLAPLVLLATHLYPNVVGAALIVTGSRFLFTAQPRRPALGATALAATLLLTPRDGLALLTLAPFVFAPRLARRLLWSRAERSGSGRSHAKPSVGGGPPAASAPPLGPVARHQAGIAIVAVVLAVVAVNAMAYGIPAPYAGYAFGTAAAQTLTNEPSITYRFWIGLPAMLFDRVFGVAGTAPWLFIGLIGLLPGLRGAPRALIPAAVTVAASLAALSFFRLWEGGYAPPNRYFVDVLPLWAPFVAYGLELARRSWPLRVVAIGLLAFSALAAFVLSAIPSAALNSAFDARLQTMLTPALGVDVLALLPSFQPIAADWVLQAYTRTAVLAAIAIALVWAGARRPQILSRRQRAP